MTYNNFKLKVKGKIKKKSQSIQIWILQSYSQEKKGQNHVSMSYLQEINAPTNIIKKNNSVKEFYNK